MSEPNFARRWFVGAGLDIGGKPDPLSLYLEFFPLMTSCRVWDWEDGDAQDLAGVPEESLDFVHSSHCLEHLREPKAGLAAWFRALRPGGFLVVTIDRKSTRLNSSHYCASTLPASACNKNTDSHN